MLPMLTRALASSLTWYALGRTFAEDIVRSSQQRSKTVEVVYVDLVVKTCNHSFCYASQAATIRRIHSQTQLYIRSYLYILIS